MSATGPIGRPCRDWSGAPATPAVRAASMRTVPLPSESDIDVATDHSDQLREYRTKLHDVKEYL